MDKKELKRVIKEAVYTLGMDQVVDQLVDWADKALYAEMARGFYDAMAAPPWDDKPLKGLLADGRRVPTAEAAE